MGVKKSKLPFRPQGGVFRGNFSAQPSVVNSKRLKHNDNSGLLLRKVTPNLHDALSQVSERDPS